MTSKQHYNAGVVGTGYIADYHARAIAAMPNAHLAAACDASRPRAASFGARYDVPAIYESVEQMLANEALDVVHVLTPPDQHFSVGLAVLDAGCHLLLEKPMCSDAAGCDSLLARAEKRNRRVGVNHNFLFHPAYERLRADVRAGLLGPCDHLAITWAMEFPQLRSGPFDMWALRHAGNLMYEIGAHAMSQVLDLLPPPDESVSRAFDPVSLPTGVVLYRRWQVLAWCGRTSIDLQFAFGPGRVERSVLVRGNLGTALADIENNVYTVHRATRYGSDLGKYHTVSSAARQMRSQARGNLRDYVLGKLKLGRQANAFAASIQSSVEAFYAGLGGAMDARCSGQLGQQVIEQCTRMAQPAGVPQPAAPRIMKTSKGTLAPADVLVLGGTGFIGRELVRQLLRGGKRVRVLTRSRGALPFETDDSNLQVCNGDIRNEASLVEALQGVHTVYHLARAAGGTWSEYFAQDVQATRRLAELCLEHSVRRFVYCSSIVVYDIGARGRITERTPYDRAILRQNKYARAKAAAERELMQLFRDQRLGLVIVRPGMVIGRGGNLCHGGLGRWQGPGVCVFWGDGNGPLPLVLVEDVVGGLIAAGQAEGIEGESFNLVDDPVMSARQYVEEIERFAGVRIQTFAGPAWKDFGIDVAKWLAKVALRMPDRYVPRYRMWRGRVPRAVFDCSKAKKLLHWQPAADRGVMAARGIHVHLVDNSGTNQFEIAQAT